MDRDQDKWAQRRAARRGQDVPAPETEWVPAEPPRNLRVAFTLWMVVGAPACLVIWGIWVVIAAFHLRAGYRGSRILLTGTAILTWLVPLLALVGGAGWLVLVSLPVVLATVLATIFMWSGEVTDYMDALRTR